MNAQYSPLESIQRWIKNSIMIKLLTITILILVLLIPTSMIESIIDEREYLNSQAIDEVSNKWANEQQINGPILSVPLLYETTTKEGVQQWTEYFHILPEQLNIDGLVNPEKLKRGIYEIVVYKSKLHVNGNFVLKTNFDHKNLKEVRVQDAFLTIGISDLRGIEDEIYLTWNEKKLKASPGSQIPNIISKGVTIELDNLELADHESYSFNLDLNLQGSHTLSFVPIGSTTMVTVDSSWPSPSFNGQFLPDERSVSDSGFVAQWKVLQLNRNFPQSWTGRPSNLHMDDTAFGVDLLLPLDDYQKSMRSVKYAIMTITLSFLVFFIVEILSKRKIHPFQYTLVGLSLSLFYILLISISEHSNFNFAYLISACAVTIMIFLYSISVFKAKKTSFLLAFILAGIYGFLFVTLQMADYALLMGSIGLTAILSCTMYFTRGINWYQINKEN